MREERKKKKKNQQQLRLMGWLLTLTPLDVSSNIPIDRADSQSGSRQPRWEAILTKYQTCEKAIIEKGMNQRLSAPLPLGRWTFF